MRRASVLFLSTLVTVGAAWAGACSTSTPVSTTSGGAAGGAVSVSSSSSSSSVEKASSTSGTYEGGFGGSGITLDVPPDAGPPQAPDGTTNVTFAITRLYLGDVDPDGGADPTSGWTHYGYNIDGVQPGYVQGFCNPAGGADLSTVRATGENGIENAWGHLVLPLLLALSPTLSIDVNQSLAAGAFTTLMTLDDLGPAPSVNPLNSLIAPGGNLGHAPKLDGTDSWPVYSDFTIPLPVSYLVANTWVATTVTAVPLYIPGVPGFGANALGPSVRIRKATISMQLDAAHKTATNGIISGVIATADLQAAIAAQAPAFSAGLCAPSSPALATLLNQVLQASDIDQDGTQDPLATCDGISIGLGFDAALVGLGAPQTLTPLPDPCPDAGSIQDAGTDAGEDGGADAGADAGDGG